MICDALGIFVGVGFVIGFLYFLYRDKNNDSDRHSLL